MWFAFAAIVLIAIACVVPYQQVLTFNANDARLLHALGSAKSQLMINGIVLARNIAITNQEEIGIPVRFAAGSEGDGELQGRCENDHPDLNGCTAYRDSSYNIDGIWLRATLDSVRLDTIVLHEMIHALFPGIEHLESNQVGVFTLNSNSPILTAADMELLGRYAEIASVDT